MIRQVAASLRAYLGENEAYVDVARLIEHKLFEHFGVILAVKDANALGPDEGRSYPDKLRIELRSDVYDALVAGNPVARYTAMHEVAHIFIHQGIPLRSTAGPATHRHFEDSEWQANTFASEFLMPVEHVLRLYPRTAAYASARFKVSLAAALVRLTVLKNEGLLMKEALLMKK
jgi:hypothetical protein